MLYDIANMAYVIADTAETDRHVLHQVRDICQDGNIHRVSRILGLAYSQILVVLSPVIRDPLIDIGKDFSSKAHDYEIPFKETESLRYLLSTEKKLKIKETCHEYMVCMVLADWLGAIYPVAADVWKYRAEKALENLQELSASISASSTYGFRRKLSPF